MKVPYTNTTTAPQYVGPHLVQPGDTRMVDDTFLPPAAGAAVVADEPESPLLSLLDGNVQEVAAALAALSDDDLAQIEAAETAGKTRKGVLTAIEEDKLRRAADRAANEAGQ